ncbi:response regulator [candidate division KSB1 bacterium]|nr:response regulator [candidate division KSB1 bacterium]
MADSDKKNDLEQQVKILETKIKHLTNDLNLTRQDYEDSMAKYFDIYSNMEKKVNERTAKLKELQNILKIKNQQLEIMVDSSPGMIFYKNSKEQYVRVNKKFAEMFGLTISNILGKTHSEIFPGDFDNIIGNDQEVLRKKAPVLNRAGFINTVKGQRHMLINKVPYKDIDGNIIGIIGFVIDMTDMYKVEQEKNDLKEKLVRAEKMEAIGLLAGGVAHDLNNILTGIVSYPDLLLLEVPEDSPLRKPIITIQESGLKAAAIVQDLLTLARRGVIKSEIANVNELINDYLNSLEYDKLKLNHPNVIVKTELDKKLLNIRCSPIHIVKTIMNLVINAAEAMPEGGTVILGTKNCHIDRAFKGYENIKEGDYVLLQVKDTGMGIFGEDINRIFEPFYTNKVMGKSGTGLGMAVVWGVVKDHKGYIDIKSKPDEGTSITLYFPVTRKNISREIAKFSINDYMGNGELILVVDDIPEQRDIASLLLKKLNYRVKSVSSGEEAIKFVKNNSVDLVILDMIMTPGIDGFDTFKEMIKFNPGQKAVITSGFSETERVKETQKLGAGVYLKKPYLFEKFARTIKNELQK